MCVKENSCKNGHKITCASMSSVKDEAKLFMCYSSPVNETKTHWYFQSKVKSHNDEDLFLGMENGTSDPNDKVIGLIPRSGINSVLAKESHRFSVFNTKK